MMKISATIVFKRGQEPVALDLRPAGRDKPWRLLSEKIAVELVPICDDVANSIEAMPPCERLNIRPVAWGYPDSLLSDYPEEVESMRQDHLAGKHDLVDGNYTWPRWLEIYGKAELWHRHHTPEMEPDWLNWRDGAGFRLQLYSKFPHPSLSGNRPANSEAINKIRFRADFYAGKSCRTVFFESCQQLPLTLDEISSSPAYIAQQCQLAEKQVEVEQLKIQNRREEQERNRLQNQLPVTKDEVMVALGVKTDRGALAIFKRHGLEDWPKEKGELAELVRMHQRRKKYNGEKLAKRNKANAVRSRGVS